MYLVYSKRLTAGRHSIVACKLSVVATDGKPASAVTFVTPMAVAGTFFGLERSHLPQGDGHGRYIG